MRQTMRDAAVILAVLIIGFMSAAPLSAHGAPNVFDDAVFWFRGGKDLNGDGFMQQGDFFDDLHANDPTHSNHNMSMVNYSVDAFKANAAFMTERVVFPALGNQVGKDMQVLRLSNKAVRNSNQNYYWPEVVNPRSVFLNNNIQSEYTIVSRICVEDDGLNRNECLFKIGYSSSAKQGMWLGFMKPASWYAGCKKITGYCTPSSDGASSNFQLNLPVPTNTWIDIAVVVGNGKLRVGICVPESLASHNNNPTIAFDETLMWTDNPLPEGDYYRLFCYTGQSNYQLSSAADTTCFLGGVQQMAIWKRALSDQEVMAAFGMPRPAIFRTGFDNDASNEFGGSRSGATQTIDGLGSWQNIANTMKAGDTWTVNFAALRDEAGLAQIFSIKSLPESEEARIEPILNGTSLGERRVAANARVFWPVPANLIVANANTLVVERKDGGAGDFLMDAMELGASLGVGTFDTSINDGRTAPERTATGIPSAADPNTQHWPQGLQPYVGITNLHFRVWVDPDIVEKATSRFWTHTQCASRSSSYAIEGNEEFTLYVNGAPKATRGAGTSWTETSLSFQPGELLGGWNDFEFISQNYTTCHWLFGYYRFETVLPRAFSLPPPGLSVIIR